MTGQDIFLNATESDIISLLGDESLGDVLAQAAHNFSFYTKVDGVNVAVDYVEGSWVMSGAEVLVQTTANTIDADGQIDVGSVGVDFLEMGNGIAMGNAGSDTYTVGDGDGGIINELGHVTIDDDLELADIEEAGDTVVFESVNSIGELTFARTKILGEKEGSTLTISDGETSSVELFDQYNDFLEFRRTEFLVIDDGATRSEIFELYTSDDANIDSWDNEIYVADEEDAITVDVGGTDYVFLGDDVTNSATINLDEITSSGSVTVSGIEGGNLTLTTTDSEGAAHDLVQAYGTHASVADSATISWSSDGLTLVVDDDIDDGVLLTQTFEFGG